LPDLHRVPMQSIGNGPHATAVSFMLTTVFAFVWRID
jgi:hypothetical protein